MYAFLQTHCEQITEQKLYTYAFRNHTKEKVNFKIKSQETCQFILAGHEETQHII